MSYRNFIMALARGARGKDAAKALILPQIFGGIGYVNAGAELTVTGTPPLSLPNSLGKPLKAWEVGLEPYQDLHGYDNPWPAGGGANILDPNIKFTNGQTAADVTLSTSDGYQITLNGTCSTSGATFVTNTIALADAVILPAGTYYANAGKYALYNESGNYIKGVYGGSAFTVDTPFYIRSIVLELVNGRNYNNTQYFTGLTKGSTGLTAWSPYSNICPISGTDKLNIFVEESYDPSATPKAVITLPQTVYSGTVRSDGGESRSVGVDMGSLNWTYVAADTVFYAAISNKKSGNANLLCSCYKTGGNTGYSTPDYTIGYSTNSALVKRVFVSDPNYTDVDSFKAAVTGQTLVYENDTPVQFPLTTPTIPTPKGTASTWATAEDGTVGSMSVTYVSKK